MRLSLLRVSQITFPSEPLAPLLCVFSLYLAVFRYDGWSEPLFYFLASATAIPEPPEMEFIFLPDFRSYGFGDLPIWSSRKRRKWRTRGRNTRGGRRYRFTFITGRLRCRKLFGFLLSFCPPSSPFPQNLPLTLCEISNFISSLKTLSYSLSLRICFGTESSFSPISSRVYEVNSDIFCFLCRAGFLPRFKTVSITIRTVINNKQRRRAPIRCPNVTLCRARILKINIQCAKTSRAIYP